MQEREKNRHESSDNAAQALTVVVPRALPHRDTFCYTVWISHPHMRLRKPPPKPALLFALTGSLVMIILSMVFPDVRASLLGGPTGDTHSLATPAPAADMREGAAAIMCRYNAPLR